MKLRYLLALPILATALMGCDEIEYSDAKPIENPQLEGITQDDFSVTVSSYLKDGLNLEELSQLTTTPESYEVPLFTINTLTDLLPEGAVVNGSIQLAAEDDPDFGNPFDVNTTTVDGVVSTTLADLAYTRSTMYGNDPRPYDVYYRISVYVNVDGGQYKMGLKDFYYNNGYDFVEEGIDPGYYVEEAYYLVGPNGNSVADAVKFEHSGYNIYDDTIFSVTAVFEKGSTWLVVPESVYEAAMESGTLDTSKCYGGKITPGEPVGDDDNTGDNDGTVIESGELVLGGTPGNVTQGLKYELKINLATLTYTLEEKPLLEVGDPTEIYLRGGMTDWAALATYEFIATDDQSIFVMPYVEIAKGIEFKVADANWGAINYGTNGTQLTPGVEYALEYNADNLSLSDDFVGSIILTKDEDGNYGLYLQPFTAATAGELSGIYLRGGMNEWGAPEEDEFLTSEYKNVWTLETAITAGTEFKVADADWSAINYGANATAGAFDETSGTGVLGLVSGGANINLAENFTGTLRLVNLNTWWYLYFILDTPAE